MIKQPENFSVLYSASNALRVTASTVALALGVMALPALAQTAPETEATAEQPEGNSDIVVTGTLLRGVAPVGTNVVSVSRKDILESGAASANDLLASIPQVGNFGTVPSGTASFGLPIVRPNIRNLAASGGSSTLVLLNGRRMVGAGVLQTSVDPSVLPPEVIDRVEIVPDGGSAIYGSDAIGGVINFITRSRFNGLAASARYGFADNYQTVDGSLTAGKDWGSGSLLVTYAYAWHDNIQNRDRSYTAPDHTAKGGRDFRSTVCGKGNFTDLVTNLTFAAPGFVPGSVNKCDANGFSDLYPREERHTVFASLTQQLSDAVSFSATAYWSRRDTTTLTQQPGITGVITAANPYYRAFNLLPPAFQAQLVSLSFDDVFGPTVTSNSRFDSYGVTPEFKFDIGDKWQLRTGANFGRSNNIVRDNTINTAAASDALGGFTTATALNPYNLAATNPAVLAKIRDYQNYGRAVQELAEARVILDGSLVSLPGGDVRLAIGGEYHYENLSSLINQNPRGVFTGAINSFSSRTVKSAFGELLVPIFGEGNGGPGMRALSISGSVRYDDYSDRGGTTNPKIGFTYKPADQLTIRGNYGTSFHAPSLADTTSTSDSRAQVLLVSPLRPLSSPASDFNRPTIILAGGNPNLKPERANTWSAGFDWRPTVAPGLLLSATYYNVNFKDAIEVPPFLSPVLFTNPGYSSFYIINPTLQQSLNAVGNLLVTGAPSIQALYAFGSPYVLIDARRNNIGAIKVSGIDFNAAYARPTSFGSIDLGVNGTYTLRRQKQAVAGDAFSDELKNGYGRLSMVVNAGGTIGRFAAKAKLNYLQGYAIQGLQGQSRVSAFTPVDLFFSYALPDTGFLKDTLLTVNIDNVFDRNPPYADIQTGYTNGSTLGRLVSFGIRKKF